MSFFVHSKDTPCSPCLQVQKATHVLTGQTYAIKILEKSHLIRNNKMHTAIAERNALAALGTGHPGVVRLHSTFQDEWRLCM